jgi:hypothetical protein
VDLIGFVEAVCTLLIVIVCPALKCEDRSADDSNSFAQAKPWRIQSRDPAKLSRILASW